MQVINNIIFSEKNENLNFLQARLDVSLFGI
jgi:hypothetical protein